MSNKICLVVSNCKNCWDTSSKLAFISESTPDYLDADEIRSTNHIILNGPWNSKEYHCKSQQFVIERVTRYRKELTSVLNSALGIDYSEKAWGILLDSWLLHFISVVHDRVNKLKNAQEKLGDIFLKCLKEDPEPIYGTLNFARDTFKDLENQQLYCDIAKVIGIKVESCVDFLPENECFSSRTEKSYWHQEESFKNKIYSMASPFFRWWVQYRKPLVVIDGYFPFIKALLIALRSFGKVLIIPGKMLLEKLPSLKKNESLRSLLKVTEEDEYDFVANKLFSKYFPLSMLEGVKDYGKKISKLDGIPLLGSAVGFYFNEEYKILASRVIENGNKIVGFQHGGNYNFQINKLRCSEYFEKLNADKYYRWREKSLSGKYLSTAKLGIISAYKEIRKTSSIRTNILFVSQRFTRFIFRYENDNSDSFIDKFIAQQNFYLNLSENNSRNFLVRDYPDDSGWRYNERWIDFTGGKIKFDPNVQFYESLVSCRVYVSDHISTSWLEAFYCDVPIILFLDLDQFFIVDEVKRLFEELQAVGVSHPTAESAASFLNEKYETIEEWWQMPETKEAVDKLRNYFFTAPSDDFTKEWTKELVALRDKTMKDKLNHKKNSMELE
jgi:putative transferase (TIGR04331 family)